MEPSIRTHFLTLVFCAGSLVSAQDAPAPTQWTNTAGVSIPGEFVKLDGNAVIILKDGKDLKIPLANLSLASREQARKLAASAAAPGNATSPPEAKASTPPTSPKVMGRLEIVPRFGKTAKLTPRALGTLPDELLKATDIVDVSVDWHRGLALKADGTVIPWGYKFSNLTPPSEEMLGANKKIIQAITTEVVDWFLYADGSIGAWLGQYNHKHLFAGSEEATSAVRAVKIAPWSGRVLALSAEGKLSSFGGDPLSKLPPNVENARIIDMAACAEVSLAVTREGKILVWGKDNNGCLDLPKSLTAIIESGKDPATLVATTGAACAVILKSGRIIFWGNETKEWNTKEVRMPGAQRFLTLCCHSNDGPALAVQDKLGKWKFFGKSVAFDEKLDRTIGTASAIGGGFEAVAVIRPPAAR